MCTPDGREDAITFGCLRETSNRLANVLRAQGIARGDRVAILLPQAPEVAAAHIAIYKLGAVALPIAVLFGPDALSYRLQNSGAKALLTNAQGLAKLDAIRGEVPDLACVLSLDGAGDGAGSFAAVAGARFGGFLSRRHRARRSGDDDLHLGHHRPAQGRAARPSRVARASARRRAAAFPVSAKPATASGRRPTGPGPAGCSTCCCRACTTASGGGAQVRQVRSGGGLRADAEGAGAQRLHPADRAAHDAGGAERARTLRLQAAHARLRRRVARGRKRWNGASPSSASPSTNSTARPNAIWCSAPAPRSACRRPGAIGKPIPGHVVAVIDRDGQPLQARRGRDRSR